MIELTDEMRAAVKRRMGIPQGDELDPWMGPAIEDVLAIVERDYTIRPRRMAASNFQGPRDHDFQPHNDPRFGSAFGGACAAPVDTDTHGRIPCGWPRIAHRTPAAITP